MVLEASLPSTVGTIQRCGRLRIELVVLLATLLNVAPAAVGGFLRERDVTGTVVVRMGDVWDVGVDGGVSVEQRSA